MAVEVRCAPPRRKRRRQHSTEPGIGPPFDALGVCRLAVPLQLQQRGAVPAFRNLPGEIGREGGCVRSFADGFVVREDERELGSELDKAGTAESEELGRRSRQEAGPYRSEEPCFPPCFVGKASR